MPSRILATHICTCVQSLRSGDAGAYAAGHLGSERKSRPEKVGEDSVPKPKSNGRCRRNARYSPDPNGVQHWMVFLGQRLPSQANCMVPPAFHVGDQRIVAASVAGIQGGGDLGSDSYRGAHMASRAGR